MDEKYEDIFYLKNKLWELRHLECSNLKTPSSSENEVMIVLKRLKTNKTRDPLGMINEARSVWEGLGVCITSFTK